MSSTDLLSDWTRSWRSPMLRFARLHIQPDEEAEDAVQDTLLAACAGAADALRQADPRPYLFGILKNKVADRLRSKYRRQQVMSDTFEDDLDDVLFDERGHWDRAVAPASWDSPESHMQSDQFFAVVDICVNKLPDKVARVFSMKELLEWEAEEVCDALGVSKADYWQCMSRARKQIQLCLNQNWFEGGRRA